MHVLPMATLEELPTETQKTADHLLPAGSSHPRGRHKELELIKILCEGLLRSAADEVTASMLRVGARFL